MSTTNSSSDPRIVLITGGNRGLGKSMALHVADAGDDVVFTYRANADEAKAVVAQIESRGRQALALALDVTDSSSFGAFAETLKSELTRGWKRDRFDALVNNAGTGLHASFAETTEAQFDELMKVHLRGPFFLTQKLLPLLADGGRILNVSSGLARFALPGASAYASMKGGIEVLTRCLAKELGPRRISVNTLAPGAIETDFNGGTVRDNPEVNRFVASVTALGRPGLPDDIGGAVALLLSPQFKWATGQRIELSGGMFV
jgi:NAD(P)-dependent dehydrogenase (short-subunit alcohol dehydrogenase family)